MYHCNRVYTHFAMLVHMNPRTADQSGYMGYTMDMIGAPRKAFNAHKHWISGWFDEQYMLAITPTDEPVRKRLIAFIDYGDLDSDEGAVVIRVGKTIFMQYNIAKGYNAETSGSSMNKVTIVRAANDSDVSDYLTGLSSGDSYRIRDFESTGSSLVIKVCTVGRWTHYYADVEISLEDGSYSRQCTITWGGSKNSILSKLYAPSTMTLGNVYTSNQQQQQQQQVDENGDGDGNNNSNNHNYGNKGEGSSSSTSSSMGVNDRNYNPQTSFENFQKYVNKTAPANYFFYTTSSSMLSSLPPSSIFKNDEMPDNDANLSQGNVTSTTSSNNNSSHTNMTITAVSNDTEAVQTNSTSTVQTNATNTTYSNVSAVPAPAPSPSNSSSGQSSSSALQITTLEPSSSSTTPNSISTSNGEATSQAP
jgi:hypothetical protein